MDWGLALGVAVVLFLVLHMALDLRGLARNLRLLGHDDDSHRAMFESDSCERCHTLGRGRQELQHEALWTAAAVIALMVHIALDFVA